MSNIIVRPSRHSYTSRRLACFVSLVVVLICLPVTLFASQPVFACQSASQPVFASQPENVGGPEKRTEQPPNIVLIISDDQAWTDFGFMDHPVIQTPNLDRFAAESRTFKRGYVPTSLCCPSLATIITGLYPSQHHVSGNDPAVTGVTGQQLRRERFLELDQRVDAKIESIATLPKTLAEQGYVSFQSGKWWHGSFAKGGFTDGMTHGDPARGGRHGDVGLQIGRQGLQPILDFVDGAQQKPFFVWYAPFLPHTPHNPPQDLLQKYKQSDRPLKLAKYYAMCEWFDQTCGELIEQIDNRGLAENTLFIFVTDNGWTQLTSETTKPEGWKKAFAPGSKQSPNEAGIRTPIMLRWKGKIEPLMDEETLVSSVDLAPTILQAAGITKPATMTGVSLLDVTAQNPLDREVLFGEIFAHDIANVDDPGESLLYRWCIFRNQKLILHYDGKTGRYGSIHEHMQGDGQPKLFDLGNDPHETEDLASENPQQVEDLKARVDSFFNQLPAVH